MKSQLSFLMKSLTRNIEHILHVDVTGFMKSSTLDVLIAMQMLSFISLDNIEPMNDLLTFEMV